MGLVIFLLICSVVISVLSYVLTGEGHKKRVYIENACWGFVLPVLISVCLCSIYYLFSYFNTVGLYGDFAKIEQRKTAMMLYGYYSDTPSGADHKIISDLTDKKYEDFQDNMYETIDDYRFLVESYNDILAEKRVLKKGFIFGWLTHCPTDLKLVVMNDNVLSGKVSRPSFKRLPI